LVMYGRTSLVTWGYECMKNHYSTNSYKEYGSEKTPLSCSRSGSRSSKLDALTQLSAPLLLRPQVHFSNIPHVQGVRLNHAIFAWEESPPTQAQLHFALLLEMVIGGVENEKGVRR
jgi:hypothetical protein